ncbi:hypothetical protein CYMTET_54695 [Cymbomonas tetramitiformis]|uniref:EF-hand domain-containing protein n=1 Tax=Cymbomonas tetramitiformis TaxID=36881 RepID=A0AAE0ENH4_9CHLO|nr:hypothetical protein CYMTET_54694 [Cymbomonas tetramitiformis]KAK3235088.1 hypothetical protein CYMTET_54695 [Cymbomonas tetramitiformis]
MKSNRTRAAEMFRKFDRDLDGRLTFGEVQTMVEAVCPGTTAADVEYFFVMLDADTSDSISFKELHQVLHSKCIDRTRTLPINVRSMQPDPHLLARPA